MPLSQRVQALAESATIAVSTKAAELKRAGHDIVAFGAGEPDFDTPPHIKAFAHAHIDAGKTKYAPAAGVIEARQAVCEKFSRENGLSFEPKNIIITCGAKEAIYLAFAALLDPGDEVILPVPYWVSFPEQVKINGGIVKPLLGDESNSFKLRPEQIREALTPRTRAFVLNSPSNPGGFTYTPDETRAIASVFRGTRVTVLADELYDRLRFDGVDYLSFAAVDDDARNRSITINSPAKTYAMTGWRVGYAAAAPEIIAAMSRVQSHTTSGPCTFNQYSMADALRADQSGVDEMRRAYQQRGRHMHARLNTLRGVACVQPTGAYYCFANVRATYAALGVTGSVEFSRLVLEKAHVALVPGIAFGSDDHVRLSFATSMEQIDKGLDRLEKLLGRK